MVDRKTHGSEAYQYLINFAADDQQVRDLAPDLHFCRPPHSEDRPPDIVGTWCVVEQRPAGWDASPVMSVVDPDELCEILDP